MARRDKFTVEYFPHNVKHGKSMFIIENRFGNNGYAFWFKMLEVLGASDHHYFDCREDENFEYLLAYTKTDEDIATKILNSLAKLKKIHPGLWDEKIIWSKAFVENIETVYKRRESFCMNYDDLCKHLHLKCIQKYDENGDTVNRKPQSKVEYSKGKETIEKDIVFPWTEKEFELVWEFWKKYKKEQFRFTYKSIISEQGALAKLQELSGGKLETAMLIIKQSIQNGWQGLFELKGEFKNKTYDREKIFADLQNG